MNSPVRNTQTSIAYSHREYVLSGRLPISLFYVIDSIIRPKGNSQTTEHILTRLDFLWTLSPLLVVSFLESQSNTLAQRN